MTNALTETERLLRESVHRRLATPRAVDRAAWDDGLLEELGLTGLLIPEHLGGAGGTLLDAIAVQEELGQGAALTSFLENDIFAAVVLVSSGDVGSELARELAAKKARFRVLVPATWSPDDASALGPGPYPLLDEAAEPPESDWVLGAAEVPGAATRLVAVRTERQASSWPPTASAFQLATSARAALARGLDAVRIALAADLNGSAQRALRLVLDYGGIRETFGRKIGSYQVFRQTCAEHWIAGRVNAALVRAAAESWQHGDADTASLAAAAAASAAEAARDASEACILLHGGIGFTWEHEAHLHLQRALAAIAYLGGTTRQWGLSLPPTARTL